MKGVRAQEKFKKASTRYHKKRYAEALEILDDLDREFPGNAKVMHSRARCLSRLRRYDEALAVCDELLKESNDPRVADLAVRIRSRRADDPGVSAPAPTFQERRAKTDRRSGIERRKSQQPHPHEERRDQQQRRTSEDRRLGRSQPPKAGSPEPFSFSPELPQSRKSSRASRSKTSNELHTSDEYLSGDDRTAKPVWPNIFIGLAVLAVVVMIGAVIASNLQSQSATAGAGEAVLRPPRWADIVLDGQLFPLEEKYWESLEATFKEQYPEDAESTEEEPDRWIMGSAPLQLSRQRVVSKHGEPDEVLEEDDMTWERFGYLQFGRQQDEEHYSVLRAPKSLYRRGFADTAFANIGS